MTVRGKPTQKAKPRAHARLPLITPPNVPTYDCDEIVHIEAQGNRLKLYFAGRVPHERRGQLGAHREIKMAIIWPVDALARAIHQVQSAAGAINLMTPEDYIGEPEGSA